MSDIPLKEHLEELIRLRDVATVELRRCNIEQFQAVDRVNGERLAALTQRIDKFEQNATERFGRLERIVFAGLGIAVALEFLIPLLRH